MRIVKKISPWTWSCMGTILAVFLVSAYFDEEISKKAFDLYQKEAHWYSIVAPLLAVAFALVLRRAVLALFLGLFAGIIFVHGLNPIVLVKATAVNYLWANFTNQFGLLFVGFVFSLIGMVSIINKAGGTKGVVNLFSGMVGSARKASIATSLIGIILFFDDYADTIIIGTSMRSVTDAVKVSREKLAFLVDATAAPVAGIAVISTWIGFEVEQLQHISNSLNLGLGGYGMFFQMIPFRYYCFFTIMFVLLNSILRRDFGPMLKAERRAVQKGDVFNQEDDTMVTKDLSETDPKEGIPHRWYNAAVPVLVVIIVASIGIAIVGKGTEAMAGKVFSPFSLESWYFSFVGIGQVENGIPGIFCVSSTAGALTAALMAISQKLLTVKETLIAWGHGWKIIFVITAFLLLAWSLRQVCDELGAPYFILSAAEGRVPPLLIPLLTFLIAAAISFATGTSWGAMSILIPTMAPIAYQLGGLPILVMSMAAVMDGAIFGDHCSPISDTTILSSISSGCDHMDHVKTQLPYAVVTMIVAALCGYIFAAYGMPVPLTHSCGFFALLAILILVGRNPEAGINERC